MEPYDVLILGAGASGLFCAAEAARRGRRVLVIDHAEKSGRKLLVTGGGRCNFTNTGRLEGRYFGADPVFPRAALERFGSGDFIARLQVHHIPFHEKQDGQLFCDRSAKDIQHMLVDDAKAAGARIECGRKILRVERADGAFVVSTDRGEARAEKIVVATGGLSYPILGATGLGYDLAREFGHEVTPTRPALVGFALAGEDRERLKGLEGIHPRVKMTVGGWSREDDLMITHRGLSGPVALEASLRWKEGAGIALSWLPGTPKSETLRRLRDERSSRGRGNLRDDLTRRLTKRLVDRLAYHAGARGAWSSLPDEALERLASVLHEDRFVPARTLGYQEAEVTQGGVSTEGIDPLTMESRIVPGLYFIGEVLDVTGSLGGFNLQWAWSSAFAAGTAV